MKRSASTFVAGAELATAPRLWRTFWGEHAAGHAKRFEQAMAEPAVRAVGSSVLIEGVRRRKRLAVLGLRHGAYVSALEGAALQVNLSWWHLPTPSGPRKVTQRAIDRAAVARAMAPYGYSLEIEEQGRGGARGCLETDQPARALEAAGAVAAELGCEHRAYLHDLDPLAHCLRRLLAEL